MIFFNFLGIRSRVQEIKCDWRAEENQRGIVIRLSNKDHLNRPLAWSWRWLLIIGSRSGKSFLYHEQCHWTFAERFYARNNRSLNACMTVLHVYKRALKVVQGALRRVKKGLERCKNGLVQWTIWAWSCFKSFLRRVQFGHELTSRWFCSLSLKSADPCLSGAPW